MASHWAQASFKLQSRKQGCYLITDQILQKIGPDLKQFQIGLCNIFLPHTSAGLSLNQNCDPTVRTDMTKSLNRLVPEGKQLYDHDCEGPDDMPAHIKSAIVGASLTIPIRHGALALGTWQGIWLMEFRTSSHSRQLMVTMQGVKQK